MNTTTEQVRTITLNEFQTILQKMKHYDLQEGYIGDVKGKMELFILPCDKATNKITRNEVEAAINDYSNTEVI